MVALHAALPLTRLAGGFPVSRPPKHSPAPSTRTWHHGWQLNTGLASLYQLFLCLAVFCEGSMQDKAQFCFEMFDADDSGVLEPEELTQFIRSIIDALFLVGEVAVRPQPATIERLAAWCFKVRRS
jgi:hypothetical protein